MMLNVTSYSHNSIVNNAVVQEEFYRLEGALDLLLDVMYNYHIEENNEPLLNTAVEIEKIGHLFYLLDGVTPHNITIAGQEIAYSVVASPNPISNPNASTYDVTITAMYADNPKINRSVDLQIARTARPVAIPNIINVPNTGSGEIIEVTSNSTIHQNRRPLFEGYYIFGPPTNYMARLAEYNIQQSEVNRVIKENINLTPNVTPTGLSASYYNNIIARNHETVVIPANTVAYANNLDWKGQKRTLVVEGTLIIKNFSMIGASTLEIKSGGKIFADKFHFWSNAAEPIFRDIPSIPPVDENGTVIEDYGHYENNEPWYSDYEITNYYTNR